MQSKLATFALAVLFILGCIATLILPGLLLKVICGYGTYRCAKALSKRAPKEVR